jgi:hypothetical protein
MDEQQPKQYSYKITTSGWLVLAIIILAVVGGVLFFISHRSGGLDKNRSTWQAIFLDNKEVYFGQVISENENSLIVRNVYYMQDNVPLQQGADAEKLKNFSIIKLGKEAHGPFDEMRINRSHVIFVEDLRADSNVVKAIEEYQNKK